MSQSKLFVSTALGNSILDFDEWAYVYVQGNKYSAKSLGNVSKAAISSGLLFSSRASTARALVIDSRSGCGGDFFCLRKRITLSVINEEK